MTDKRLTVQDYDREIAFALSGLDPTTYSFSRQEVGGVLTYIVYHEEVELGRLTVAPPTRVYERVNIQVHSTTAERAIRASWQASGGTSVSDWPNDEHERNQRFSNVWHRVRESMNFRLGTGKWAMEWERPTQDAKSSTTSKEAPEDAGAFLGDFYKSITGVGMDLPTFGDFLQRLKKDQLTFEQIDSRKWKAKLFGCEACLIVALPLFYGLAIDFYLMKLDRDPKPVAYEEADGSITIEEEPNIWPAGVFRVIREGLLETGALQKPTEDAGAGLSFIGDTMVEYRYTEPVDDMIQETLWHIGRFNVSGGRADEARAFLRLEQMTPQRNRQRYRIMASFTTKHKTEDELVGALLLSPIKQGTQTRVEVTLIHEMFANLVLPIFDGFCQRVDDTTMSSGGGTGKRQDGPTARTQERASIFKRLKEQHPTWSQARLAMEATEELGEVVSADTVRNTYRAMGWKWERADRVR